MNKQKLHKKILIIIFVVIILTFPAASFIFMPKEKPAFSENENRFLGQYIKPSLKNPNNIKDKQFMDAFDTWFADRFISRENWIILQNQLEMLQGKTEINDVFVAGDRMMLVWRDDELIGSEASTIEQSVTAVCAFAMKMQELYGAESYVMLIPSAQEIYMDTLPPNSQPGNQAALIKHCYDNLTSLNPIDIMTYLSENSRGYIYYRTDHHWTTYGSYWGYYAASKKLGITPYELGRFNVEHASSDFRGTLYSKTLNSRISPDIISFYTLNSENLEPPQVRLTIGTGAEIAEYSTLYFREYLTQKDKYSAFMGPNTPIMEITSDIDNDKSLLVFKDSFANCMLPFLANHYSRITVLDMRYINIAIEELINLEEYSQVLFVYGATNFAEDDNLKKLVPIE